MTRSPIHPLGRVFLCAMAVAAWAVLTLLVFALKAEAHDALPTASKPLGWSYPFSCCAGYDCRTVPATAIIEGARGYEIRRTGELIDMSDTRIKDSPDGEFHWCSVAGAEDGKTICLFVPPRGF